MEEAIYILAPIAVAVFAYLLEHRNMKRWESLQDELKDRMRGIELAFVANTEATSGNFRLYEKSLEVIHTRLESLEAADGGVPKEHGDAIVRELAILRSESNGLAQMVHGLRAEVDDLKDSGPNEGDLRSGLQQLADALKTKDAEGDE